MTAVIANFPAPADARNVALSMKPPTRAIPLLYLGTAHASLLLACVLAGLWPRAVAGFFYHSWMVAIVHLVTLGWITFSILGAIYIVGPLALRMAMPGAPVGLRRVRARRHRPHRHGRRISGSRSTAGWRGRREPSRPASVHDRRIAARRGARAIQPAVKLHLVLACANFCDRGVDGHAARIRQGLRTSCRASCCRTCSRTRIWPRSGGRR